MTAIPGRSMSVAEFRRMWEDRSITVQQMGEMLGGISPQAVASRARKRGLADRTYRRGDSRRKIDVAEFREMWAFGVSAREIAAHFGISEAGVKVAVARYDLPRRQGRSACRPLRTVADFRAEQMRQRMCETAAAERRAVADHWAGAA